MSLSCCRILWRCQSCLCLVIRDADGNENVKKIIGLTSKTTTSHAYVHHALLYISFLFCTTTTWKCLILRFMEDVNKLSNDEILFLFLSLATVPWNSASGGFAYIWRSKWVGIIAIKTEETQIHFLSDVLLAVASLDLKISIKSYKLTGNSYKTKFVCSLFVGVQYGQITTAFGLCDKWQIWVTKVKKKRGLKHLPSPTPRAVPDFLILISPSVVVLFYFIWWSRFKL